MTALVEHLDGTWEIITWDKIHESKKFNERII
jgi:hypothetical protein